MEAVEMAIRSAMQQAGLPRWASYFDASLPARTSARFPAPAATTRVTILVGEPIPILYVQMDGTGILVVKKETEEPTDKVSGQPAHPNSTAEKTQAVD